MIDDKWKDINTISNINKNLIDNYFKDVKGKYYIDNNILYVDIDSWGIEKFYIKNNSKYENNYYNINCNSIDLILKNNDIDYFIYNYVKDNETINSEYENQSLMVNQANGSLRFWTVIACIFFIIVLNQFRGKRATVASIFWLLIMIARIVLSFSISNVSGFTVWTILILIIILMKMDIIPSPKNEVTV
mgnify:CR=1 FL=1